MVSDATADVTIPARGTRTVRAVTAATDGAVKEADGIATRVTAGGIAIAIATVRDGTSVPVSAARIVTAASALLLRASHRLRMYRAQKRVLHQTHLLRGMKRGQPTGVRVADVGAGADGVVVAAVVAVEVVRVKARRRAAPASQQWTPANMPTGKRQRALTAPSCLRSRMPSTVRATANRASKRSLVNPVSHVSHASPVNPAKPVNLVNLVNLVNRASLTTHANRTSPTSHVNHVSRSPQRHLMRRYR